MYVTVGHWLKEKEPKPALSHSVAQMAKKIELLPKLNFLTNSNFGGKNELFELFHVFENFGIFRNKK